VYETGDDPALLRADANAALGKVDLPPAASESAGRQPLKMDLSKRLEFLL
jgi:hypothetical protein